MTTPPRNYTPLAILVGAAIIAVALFFALRRPAAPAATSAPATQAGQTAAPGDKLPAPAAPPDAALRPESTVANEVAAALDAQRARFVKDCWQPALAVQATPATSRYLFNITVDANGAEIARGISELRDVPSRADVAQCLRAIVDAPVHVAPPGRNVGVDVTFNLP